MADEKDQEIERLRAELDSRAEVPAPEAEEDPRDAEIARLRAQLKNGEKADNSAGQPVADDSPVSRDEYNRLRKEMDDLKRKNSQTNVVEDTASGGEPVPLFHHLADGRVVEGVGHGTLWSEVLDDVEKLTPIIATFVREVA